MAATTLVIDAREIASRLADEDYLLLPDDPETTFGPNYVARAQAYVDDIEAAGAIGLAGWEGLATRHLSVALALLSHLNPVAVIAPLAHGSHAPSPAHGHFPSPGWACCLNNEHTPHFDDPAVTTTRYTADRPFHPGRLLDAFDGPIADGAAGRIVRSAGFCQLASRLPRIGLLSHVGTMISLDPTPHLGGVDGQPFGQDLAFTGIAVRESVLTDLLDGCLLGDAEFSAGPRTWSQLADAFTPWHDADGRP